jgi:tellurite resistance protein TerC
VSDPIYLLEEVCVDFNVIFFIVFQVIIIDGILSLDNAAVLGAMAARLPPHTPAPLAPWLRRMLGQNQQEAALKVGLFGAYVGRSLMLFLGGVIIAFPLLKVLGALYLFNLVAGHFEIYEKVDRYTRIFTFLGKITQPIKTLSGRLLINNNASFLATSLQRLVANPFWRIVITVEAMDLVFSLDNVIAILALSEDLVILIVGICISILIMRFAATQFLKLIKIEPLLVHAAYVLILAIGVELLLRFFKLDIIDEWMQFVISMTILIVFIVCGRVGRKRSQIQPEKGGIEEISPDEGKYSYLHSEKDVPE